MKKSPIENRSLFTGDNLEVMRAMNSETADLIYLDPPFNKKFVFPIGKGGNAEFGFKDIWGWESAPDEGNPFLPYAELYAYGELLNAAENCNPLINRKMAGEILLLLNTIGEISGHAEMAYLSFMAARLAEMRRILKPTGSIYLHCDPTMSHSLKLLMDIVFGGGNFRNEIIWCYKGGFSNANRFMRKTDNILFYSKSNGYVFNKQYTVLDPEYIKKSYNKIDENGRRYKQSSQGGKPHRIYLDTRKGNPVLNWWADIQSFGISTNSKERTGYPTQKPLALLERIIKASSNEGDLVLDPFCGCATTCVAAERLGRKWLGIDVASHAANLVRKRLMEETKQGNLGEKVPKIRHWEFYKGECPMRTDLGETRSKNIKQILYGQQEGKCNLCKNHFEIRYFHVDHITPKAKGGPDCDRNLQLLCAPCNAIKSTHSMEHARRRLRELGYIS